MSKVSVSDQSDIFKALNHQGLEGRLHLFHSRQDVRTGSHRPRVQIMANIHLGANVS